MGLPRAVKRAAAVLTWVLMGLAQELACMQACWLMWPAHQQGLVEGPPASEQQAGSLMRPGCSQ